MGFPRNSYSHFPLDFAGFPCRDPAIPSPRSFHGVKICSEVEKDILLPKLVLTFHCLNKFFGKLQILSLQPQISKVFLDP
jgi:hypothetical protein